MQLVLRKRMALVGAMVLGVVAFFVVGGAQVATAQLLEIALIIWAVAKLVEAYCGPEGC